MNNIILHISDLHVSLDKNYDGTSKNHNSYLSANSSNDSSLDFIERFVKFIKSNINDATIYLLITGDITDSGEQVEFEFAEQYLNKLVAELGIKKTNILLVPGDHDLNRRNIENILANQPDSSIEDINEAKFLNFKNFYKKFLDKDFDTNAIIVDNLIIQDRIQLLGINSAYKIDLKQKSGAISIEKFENELKKYTQIEGLKNIFCCHHNLLSSHENRKSGQWDVDNRYRVLAKLQEKSINFIFSGNEHTSSLEKYAEGEIVMSDSGPLTSKSHDAAFKIYELNINDDITLLNKIFGLVKSGAFENPYHWEQRSNVLCKQDSVLNIFIKESPFLTDGGLELPTESSSVKVDEKNVNDYKSKVSSINIYYNPKYTDALYQMVKELKVFYTGHFHWSETSRAHNWIDISKLIENKDNLNFLTDSIIDVLDSKIGAENIDLVIGLGYEGNILATKSAIKNNIAYSFLPYSYRHHEHHKFETLLNFDNQSKQFKNVLIITDVVNDGRTIRKLIKKRQTDFFNNVEKIFVISLFYTGDSNLNCDILNFDFIKKIPNYDLESDECVNNIEFYCVKNLKVEKCPYGKNFRDECFIYKDDLSCVNLFYDEKKYMNQNFGQ